MNIEKQVVSLELAKQLERAGFPQDGSYFIWIEHPETTHPKTDGLWWIGIRHHYPDIEKNLVFLSASTVAELGEKLKRYDNQMPVWDNYSKKWLRTYRDYKIIEDTEANARGEMYLYLKKNGLIK